MPRVVADDAEFAAALRLYPLAGLVVGAIVIAAARAGGLADAWVGALAGLAAWVLVTGALHLDGLADLADGLGAAHRDRDRMLAVMADPHAGSFAVTAIALQLIAKLVLLHGLGGDWRVLLVPFAARIGPLVWARLLLPLKPGLGATIAQAARWRDVGVWALAAAGAAIVAPGLAVAFLLIPGWALWLRWRVGGITGDCHGAGIELVETGLLAALLLF
nr:adenosylcobinamide-GDP ribazoletransferase [Sphingomonas quercus]